MADTPSTVPDAVAPAAAEQTASTEPAAAPAAGEVADDAKVAAEAPKEDAENPADATKTEAVATTKADAGKKEAADAPEAAPAAAATETPNSKKNNNRRKSVGGGLSRKGSKARLTHTDAKPGDHFLMKLKGFPPWPVIICDESMLPPALTSTRPVSAAKADGSYADAYADGGKRVQDRTFPVMYLCTNEFGWAANTTLTELTAEKASNAINDKMRKDLREAFELAAEQHPVEHYKEVLAKFEEELIAQQKAFDEAEAARMEAAATPKKNKKSKKADDDDVEMVDVDSAKPKSKKRKAEDETSTPQRSDSVKKPKIKLNTSSTPKANGTPSKKAESAVKTKSDKKVKDAKEVKKVKEPKMTPEEKRERKQREVFFLRHKLQKGLLSKDTPPVESEMKAMSEFLTALETFTDLEASIIRETKINKVLKAILKMESIPREEEFTFKKRSQGLLDKWNKLLASAAAAAPAGNTNGVNGSGGKKDTKGAPDGAPEGKSLPERPAEAKDEAKDEAEPAEPVKAEEKAPEVVAEATD